MSPPELSGLAHRIKVLSRATSLSCVLVGNTDANDVADLAQLSSSNDEERVDLPVADVGQGGPGWGKSWYVSGGYDPRDMMEDALLLEEGGEGKGGSRAEPDPLIIGRYLDGIRDLTMSMKGGDEIDPVTGRTKGRSRVPVISVPHGSVNDGGSWLLSSSYVLVTSDTSLSVRNPSKGLSLDPSGLSFILPRMGWDYDNPASSNDDNNPASKYSMTAALILSLTGYVADADDLVRTGLATHYLGSSNEIGTLERVLSDLDPWDRQGHVRRRAQDYGERYKMLKGIAEGSGGDAGGGDDASSSSSRSRGGDRKTEDHWIEEGGNWDMRDNGKFKNVAVSTVIDGICLYDASQSDSVPFVRGGGTTGRGRGLLDKALYGDEDPSLIYPDEVRGSLGRESTGSRLMDWSSTFHHIFKEEGDDIVGISERLREIASNQMGSNDEGERECGYAADELVAGMDRHCPLSLKVIHGLMREGGRGRDETLEGCMERERRVQMKMARGADFRRWADSGMGDYNPREEGGGVFRDWKHKTLADVTDDEVKEILG